MSLVATVEVVNEGTVGDSDGKSVATDDGLERPHAGDDEQHVEREEELRPEPRALKIWCHIQQLGGAARARDDDGYDNWVQQRSK